MSLAEIGHRVAEQFSMLRFRLAWRAGLPLAGELPAVGDVSFLSATESQLGIPDCCLDAFNEASLLEGAWPALGFDWQWTDVPDVWRMAPDTGRHWPADFFGAIPYRAGNPYGDIRVAWEPARLQQLVALGLIAQRSAGAVRTRATELLERQLLSFVRANPSLDGIHYVSAMECGLRILSVCHAFDIVRSWLHRPDEVRRAVLGLVAEHAAIIERRLSLHSSAGNHTIAECAGLAYAGLLFPELPGASRWVAVALPLLEAEAQRQILEDGGGVEQAFWYLLFIAELTALVCDLQRRCGREASVGSIAASERAGDFLRAMACNAGTDVLPVGDRDDGYALVPGLRLVLDRAEAPPAALLQTFAQSGYSVLRGGPSGDWSVVFDHGPLGMPPSFGHGHADALSLILRTGEQDLLIDPGTFTYTGDPELRRHFRSAFAHNTVTIDGLDQAEQQTAFMWSSPFQADCLHAVQRAEGVFVLARHDGYRRVGATHYRGLMLVDEGLLVWDQIAGGGEHYVELRWHCAAAATVNGNTVNLETGQSLELSGVMDLSLSYGQENSSRAVRATRYGELQRIWEVRGIWTGKLPHAMLTIVGRAGKRMPQSLIQTASQVFLKWSLDRPDA